MAPLPPNSTARLFLDYSDGQHAHTLSWRYDQADLAVTDVMDALDAFLTAFTTGLYLITILSARYQLTGETITTPVAWTGAATYGSGSMPAVDAPREVRFLARSSGGRKTSFAVYGSSIGIPATYRYNVGDNAAVDAAIAQLQLAADISAFITIEGLPPTVYQFADVNFNSYWERKARG